MAQRRSSSTGIIMVAGQKIALGRTRAGQVVTVHVAAETVTIDLDEDTRTVRRTTSQAVRSIKAHRPREILGFMTPSEKLAELLAPTA